MGGRRNKDEITEKFNEYTNKFRRNSLIHTDVPTYYAKSCFCCWHWPIWKIFTMKLLTSYVLVLCAIIGTASSIIGLKDMRLCHKTYWLWGSEWHQCNFEQAHLVNMTCFDCIVDNCFIENSIFRHSRISLSTLVGYDRFPSDKNDGNHSEWTKQWLNSKDEYKFSTHIVNSEISDSILYMVSVDNHRACCKNCDIVEAEFAFCTLEQNAISNSTFRESVIKKSEVTQSRIYMGQVDEATLINMDEIRESHIKRSSLDGSYVDESCIYKGYAKNITLTNSKYFDLEFKDSHSQVINSPMDSDAVVCSRKMNHLVEDILEYIRYHGAEMSGGFAESVLSDIQTQPTTESDPESKIIGKINNSKKNGNVPDGINNIITKDIINRDRIRLKQTDLYKRKQSRRNRKDF